MWGFGWGGFADRVARRAPLCGWLSSGFPEQLRAGRPIGFDQLATPSTRRRRGHDEAGHGALLRLVVFDLGSTHGKLFAARDRNLLEGMIFGCFSAQLYSTMHSLIERFHERIGTSEIEIKSVQPLPTCFNPRSCPPIGCCSGTARPSRAARTGFL